MTEQTIGHTTGFYPVNPDTATLWRQLSTGDLYVDMVSSSGERGMVRVYAKMDLGDRGETYIGLVQI